MAQNCIHLIHSYFNFHCIPIYSYKNTVKNPLAALQIKKRHPGNPGCLFLFVGQGVVSRGGNRKDGSLLRWCCGLCLLL